MSVEGDLLRGLRDLIKPTFDGDVTLFALNDADDGPDKQAALTYNRGPTEPLGRWAQGVLTLISRNVRGNPLATHDAADPVVAQLIHLEGAALGMVTVNWVDHRGTSAGLDGSKRTVRVDTFYLDLDYQA